VGNDKIFKKMKNKNLSFEVMTKSVQLRKTRKKEEKLLTYKSEWRVANLRIDYLTHSHLFCNQPSSERNSEEIKHTNTNLVFHRAE